MDRNGEINTIGSEKMESLSARRAWIEIKKVLTSTYMYGIVALRKESVDRNRLPRYLVGVYFGSLSARRAWIEMPKIG